MKKLILASTSTLHGGNYLEYLLSKLKHSFAGVDTVLFIPYARPSGISYDQYTDIAAKAFDTIGVEIKGIHQYQNPRDAVREASGIFTGGGNTFELVNQLYKQGLIYVLKRSLEQGTPYLGTSAGTNICGVSMMNTNDMPIVYPPSFTTLGVIPFNINAHYFDPDPNSKHMGETRETRIKEFHVFNPTSVLGLREGSWLEVNGDKILLNGEHSARWFQQNKTPLEIDTGCLIP